MMAMMIIDNNNIFVYAIILMVDLFPPLQKKSIIDGALLPPVYFAITQHYEVKSLLLLCMK